MSTPHAQPPVAAVVINWNMAELTSRCIESLACSRYPHLQLIIVDNGSHDGSADLLAQRFPQATLVRSAQNVGFAAGANLGIRAALQAGVYYVLLANNDTFVAHDMLPVLVAALEADPTSGIAGPLICYAAAPELTWYLADVERRWLPVPRRLGAGQTAAALHGPPRPVDYVCGCGLLVRRSVFERVGLLDERFFMYFEDADFCRRARAAGFNLWAVPAARMWHHVSLSAGRVAGPSRERLTRYRILFYRRYWRGLQLLAAAAFVLFAALRTLAGDLRRGQFELLLPTLRGFVQGWTLVAPARSFATELFATEGTEDTEVPIVPCHSDSHGNGQAVQKGMV